MNNTTKLILAVAIAAGVGVISLRMMQQKKEETVPQEAAATKPDAAELPTKNIAVSGASPVTITTKAELEGLISKQDKPVIIKFSTTWCPPCKAIKPIFQQVAGDRQDRAYFGEVDVDGFKDNDYLTSFAVQSIPTIIIFKSGKEVNRTMGLRDKQSLEAEFAKFGA